MKNLIDARKALNAELELLRAKAEQIIALLDGLNALDVADVQKIPEDTKKPEPAIKAAPAKKKAAPAKKKATPAKKAEPKKAEPTALMETGGDWFADLMGKPALRADIFAAAVKKAGGNLSKETTLQLSRRMDAALARLTKVGTVKREQTEAGFVYSKA